jgi:hypothetical protein
LAQQQTRLIVELLSKPTRRCQNLSRQFRQGILGIGRNHVFQPLHAIRLAALVGTFTALRRPKSLFRRFLPVQAEARRRLP